jgi:predicted secreted protein
MTIVSGIVIYCIMWFVVLFTVLPWGVRTQDEEGEVEPGTAESAPINPNIWRKLLITSLVTGVLFAAFWAVVEYELIDFRGIVTEEK